MPAHINLFVSCHRDDVAIPENRLVRPIQVGAAGASRRFPDMLHDDEGDNISLKNKSYCELTGQYWVWKHVDADYYGFLHYRRYFNFTSTAFPEHHEPFIFGDVVMPCNDAESLAQIGFDEATMRQVIESCDFIAPTAVEAPNGATVYEQYRDSVGHHIEDLDTALAIIKCRYPRIWESAEAYFAQTKSYVCNMFVMKRALFDEYSDFLFTVLAEHERLCDSSHYTAVGRRVSGYLGERLCGAFISYLYDNGFTGRNLQRVYFRNQVNTASSGAPARPEGAGVKMDMVARGAGKLYARLSASAPEREIVRIAARSKTSAGDVLPVKTVVSGNEHVLVLPLTDVPQHVSVRIDAEDGTALGSETFLVRPGAAMVRSRVNGLVKRGEIEAVRNCDKSFLPGDTRVLVDDVIPEEGSNGALGGTVSRLVRGTVAYVRRADDPLEFVEIDVIDTAGKSILVQDWICMGDARSNLEGHPGRELREIAYSARVSCGEGFIVWARFPDGQCQDGFCGIEPLVAADKERDWLLLTLPACECGEYDAWFRRVHRASPAELALQRERRFAVQPVFSIIVPLFKTPLSFLRDMARSVIAQTYGAWELVLVNTSPEDAGLAGEVEALRQSDTRIKVVSLPENYGITENTNAGIDAATGDFLCFLDHDDVLEPDALFCYAAALEDHPDIDMFYCDEDKLLDETYVNPNFKPDFDPELLMGVNYICHFLAVRATIVDAMPRPRKAYDGSQDYNMTLQASERARRIQHVPRVLYHWRIHKKSTAMRATQKDYAFESSRLVLQEHLDRMGIAGTVRDSRLSPRRFAVDYDLADEPLVSIVIPNKDAVRVLHRCVTSLLSRSSYRRFEIVIAENNSTEPETFDYYKTLQQIDPRIRVVTVEGMQGFNFSKIINVGVGEARGDVVVMLNNDTEVISPDWIEQMLGNPMRDGVGITGAKLYFPDDTIQHAGVVFCPDGPGHLGHRLPRYARGNMESLLFTRSIGAVTGACLMLRKSTFYQVGGMDEALTVNYNDIDLCLKVRRAGLRVVFCAEAELYHYESVTRGAEVTGEKALRFRREKGMFMEKWPEAYEQPDPYESIHFERGSIFEKLDLGTSRSAWTEEE